MPDLKCGDGEEKVPFKLHDDETAEGNEKGYDEVELCEYISPSGDILLACVCAQVKQKKHERKRLEAFALHTLGQNLSDSNATIMFTKYNLSSSESVASLRALYRSERLLSINKDFPPSSTHEQIGRLTNKAERARAKFTETMLTTHAKRIAYMSENVGSKEEALEISAIDEFIDRNSLMSKYGVEVATDNPKALLKELLEWFQEEFPYYYSGCQSPVLICSNNHEVDKKGAEFIGCVYPNMEERDSRAGICELYLCDTCKRISRFPRFHSMRAVLETRRGRCGEYSILMLRILEQLGYRARYVADWADHVWVEVQLGLGEDEGWVHVDSCEASIDEPLIYHGWGKNQTHIYSFHPHRERYGDEVCGSGVVEDVTLNYTPEAEHPAVKARRCEDGLDDQTIAEAMAQAADLITQGLDPDAH